MISNTKLSDISKLVMPIFKKYDIDDVYIIEDSLNSELNDDSSLILIYDNSTSRVKHDVDELFKLIDDVMSISSNIVCASMSSLKSDKSKSKLLSKIKLEAIDE